MTSSVGAKGDLRQPHIGAGSARVGGYWSEGWRRLRMNRVGIVSGALLGVLGLVALAAPTVSSVTGYEFDDQDLRHVFAAPSGLHLLGTDELGRDILTRLVWGARVSLGIGFLTVALFLAIGSTVGMVAGFMGGWIDEVLMRFVDMLLAIPTIYLLILLTVMMPFPIGPVVLEHGPVALAVVIAAIAWGRVARLVRGETVSLKARDFVLAARAVGARDTRIITRYIFPNVLPVMIVIASVGVGQIILVAAALDFIGLGVQPPTPTWGGMLTRAQAQFFLSPLIAIAPGACLFVTVMAANLFGNAVRDAFDPRLTSERQ